MQVIYLSDLDLDFDLMTEYVKPPRPLRQLGEYDPKELDGFFRKVSEQINLLRTAPEWIEVTSFANTWVNFNAANNSAAYCKDAMGFVHIRGMVKDGTDWSTIFTLPVGYRPAKQEIFVTISNDAVGRIDINTDGGVGSYVINDPTWVSLDGITFYAG